MENYHEIRLSAIAAARAGTDRQAFLASRPPDDRSDAALVFDRCQEYDQEIEKTPDWTDAAIVTAQARLYKDRVIAEIHAADGCGYRDLAYRVQRSAMLSPGAARAISRLHVPIPTRAEAIESLEAERAEDLGFAKKRYGL